MASDDPNMQNDSVAQDTDFADVKKHSGNINKKKGMIGFLLVVFGTILLLYLFTGKDDKAKQDAKKKVLDVKQVSEANTEEEMKPNNTTNAQDVSSLNDIADALRAANVKVPTIVAPPEITNKIEAPEIPKLDSVPLPPSDISAIQNTEVKAKPLPPVVSSRSEDVPSVKPPATIKDIGLPAPGGKNIDKTRRANPMIAMGGGGGSSSKKEDKKKDSKLLDLTNDDIIPDRSSDQIDPTHLGDMRYVIAQGTIMDAILETAINTDLEGMVRAVISRDVYAEAGRKVLIPKGSRLIGEYETTISYTQSRVNVSWTRLILPSGLDFELENPDATDELGRAGVRGTVKNKIGRMFGNAFLLSSIKLLSGVLLDKIIGDSNVIVETDGGSTTTTGSVMAQLSAEAITDLTNNLTDLIERYNDDQPAILVNQGAKLKVFVNKDMIFPSQLYK